MKQLFYECKMRILHRLRSPNIIQDILLITNLHSYIYIIPVGSDGGRFSVAPGQIQFSEFLLKAFNFKFVW